MTDAPQGVRLEYDDGTTSDVLPVLYLGVENGQAREALAPDQRRPTAVLAAVIPPRTSILVGFA